LAGEVGRGEHRLKVHDSDGGAFVEGDEEHRLAFAQASEQETARRLLVRRLLVKLPISVKQRGDSANVGGRGLYNIDLEGLGVHSDKETRQPCCVNLFVTLESGSPGCDATEVRYLESRPAFTTSVVLPRPAIISGDLLAVR
jgi:hypothetical protein